MNYFNRQTCSYLQNYWLNSDKLIISLLIEWVSILLILRLTMAIFYLVLQTQSTDEGTLEDGLGIVLKTKKTDPLDCINHLTFHTFSGCLSHVITILAGLIASHISFPFALIFKKWHRQWDKFQTKFIFSVFQIGFND